jgi:YD repeat-containing protein
LLRSSRQLIQDYKKMPDWLPTQAPPDLEDEVFTSSSQFDALNRPIAVTAPDQSVMIPVFNEANLLNQVKVKLRGAVAETLFVKNIDYDAKGQRTRIDYANGSRTTYTYDEQTFRLIRLLTTRGGNQASSPLMLVDAGTLQDLNYTYDPVGNITEIRDGALPVIFYNNKPPVDPVWRYAYDALYRLILAQGREHAGQTAYQPTAPRDNYRDYPFQNLPNANDMQALRNYSEGYEYDAVGNILAMKHGDWSREYDYEVRNNRLRATSLPGDGAGIFSAKYEYDTHGNMTKMPHLPLMRWNFKDQLQATSRQVRNDGGTSEITYFVYDAGGQRVRKVTEAQAMAGETAQRMKERMYLGGFEVYRCRGDKGT